MKRLAAFLLGCSAVFAQPFRPYGQFPANAQQPAVWNGPGLPGSIPLSVLGDLYINTAASPPVTYQCYMAIGCNAVATGNWQLIGSGGGGGGAVASVFGRTGIVVAQSGDYTAPQVGAPQQFFGTAAPGSVAGNLPGAFFSDTTNHNTYKCGAPSGTAAPACTSVGAGQWEIQNQPVGPTCTGGTAGGICMTEGADFTPQSAICNLDANASDHHLHFNCNNGTTFDVPGMPTTGIPSGHLVAMSASTFDFADGGTGSTTTISSGTSALGTASINSLACATVVTTAATGVAATDTIIWTPNASIKAVTGYAPATAGGLSIGGYLTAGNVNWDVCNWSTGAITPGAVTLNWRIVR